MLFIYVDCRYIIHIHCKCNYSFKSVSQEKIVAYDEQKQKLQLKIPRLLQKRRDTIKNWDKTKGKYHIPGDLIEDTEKFKDLLIVIDDEISDDEYSDDDESYYGG